MQNRYWLYEDYQMIYEVSISDTLENVDGREGYITYSAELVCGKEYPTDNYGIDYEVWCSPDYFSDSVKYETIVQYFETESLVDAIADQQGWVPWKGPLPEIYEWVDEE